MPPLTPDDRAAIRTFLTERFQIEGNDLRDNMHDTWNISTDSLPNVKRARNQE
jgi:hypothetical protein